jgi:putative phosphoribosyl transferase
MEPTAERLLTIAIPPHSEGLLGLPAGKARGLVLFAHGSGSSRFSPRNTYVAEQLRQAGLATLLFDLLTESESQNRANVFDIDLLAARLRQATEFVIEYPATRDLPIAYFGASTGAAAALVAAAQLGKRIGAVVSRGGRPDMAGAALARVAAPTLLIVGGADPEVLALNQAARRSLRCACDLMVVPGATHLFEEPGTLEQVVALARDWFLRHLDAQHDDRVRPRGQHC